MSDRDWSKELAKIDKQLESISDEAIYPDKRAPEKGSVPARTAPQRNAVPSSGGGDDVPTTRAKTSTLGVMLRLVLAIALGVAMVFWPYESRCGVGLFGYLGAVLAVIAGGVWSSVWTWRHRAGRAHTLALLIVTWGLVLGAMEVLPRIGYAKPDALRPAGWACKAPVATPVKKP